MLIAIIVAAAAIIAVVLYFLLRKPDRMSKEELVESVSYTHLRAHET